MKLIILTLSFAFIGCTIKPSSNNTYLDYEKVFRSRPGITTEQEIKSNFGNPTSRTEKSGIYTLNYNDPKTGFQRASLNFRSADSRLVSLLWIPQASEDQFDLHKAKLGFKNSQFTEIDVSERNPHSISRTIDYVDEKNGIEIRHSETRRGVEAISKFDVTVRSPATIKTKRTGIPYSL